MKAKRESDILNFIIQNGATSYETICNRFDISMSTARRDIDHLVAQKYIQKVYGGVVPLEYTSLSKDSDLSGSITGSKKSNFSERLDHIGKLAASHVNDGDIIYIGSGTTVPHMLPYLKGLPHLTIVTNNILVAASDMQYSNEIILMGGRINYHSKSTVGVSLVEDLARMSIHKTFVSCNGLTLKKGFSNLEDDETYIKKAAFRSSEKTYMLLDSSKFDKVSLYAFASFDDVDGIITDKRPDESYIAACEQNGVLLQY